MIDYSEEIGVSPNHLNKIIKTQTKRCSSFWIKQKIMNMAIYLLTNTGHSISQISYLLGFADPNYFSKAFKIHTGVSPRAFIKNSLYDC